MVNNEFGKLKSCIVGNELNFSKEEEIEGLDIGEHGMEAYPDFQGFLTK